MKKVICLLLVFALCLPLCACGGEKSISVGETYRVGEISFRSPKYVMLQKSRSSSMSVLSGIVASTLMAFFSQQPALWVAVIELLVPEKPL